MYIDDGICASKSQEQCAVDTKIIVDDLALAGFILNKTKSKLSPQRTGQWLGIILDALTGRYFEIVKLMHSIDSVLATRLAPAHLLASITSQTVSMSLAIGPMAWLRTRALYEVVNKRRFWSDKLQLSLLAHEVLFRQSSLPSLNGRPIWFSPSATRVVFSDASSTGYGGCHTVEIGLSIAHGQSVADPGSPIQWYSDK